VERGRGENVPMQPRRRWEDAREWWCWRVFQVMNIGWEEFESAWPFEVRDLCVLWLPLGLEFCEERYWL